jgi:KaiC/GvpD/RAD55 family RecA-like ATPase
MTKEKVVKKATGSILSLVAGMIILVNSIWFVPLIVRTLARIAFAAPATSIAVSRALPILAAVGVTLGVIVIISAILTYVPGKEVISGTLVIVFSLFSIVIGGGFLIGLILGIIGGNRVRQFGQKKSKEIKPIMAVEEVIRSDRLSTGTKELDMLLLGGIPKGYSVILTAPPSDERELLIKRFLETGVDNGQITFHISKKSAGLGYIANESKNYFLFMFNSGIESEDSLIPNVFRMQGINLTRLSIALTKAFRNQDQSLSGPKRACIDVVSDILLSQKVLETRRWLEELIPKFRSKGFTTLLVINPLMHPPEQLHAILDLFDGEINLYEDATKVGAEKFLKIKKLRKKEHRKNYISFKIKE